MTGDTENRQQNTRTQSRRTLLQTMGAAAVGVGGVTAGVQSARAEAEFDLEIVNVPDQIIAGQRSDEPLEVLVTNRGESRGTQEIRVNIGRFRQDLTLDGGRAKTLKITLSPRRTLTGDQRIEVECKDDIERTRVQILEPADYRVEIGEVDERIVAGREFSFDMDVTNEGEAQESKGLEWSVEERGSFGDVVQQGDTQVGVPGGETNTISQTVRARESGSTELLIQASTENDAGSKIVEQIPPQDPAFQVTIGAVGEASEGDELSVPVEVFNSGDFEGTEEVTASVGGTEVLTQEFTIGQRSQTETELAVPIPYDTAGEQALNVGSETNQASEIIEIAESPQFEVNLLRHSPTIPPQSAAKFEVEATNVADVGGEGSVRAVVGELGESGTSFELESGASRTVSLSVGVGSAEPGTYQAAVQSAPPVTATSGMREEVQVEVAQAPYFEATSVSVDGPVQAGEDIQVTVTISNSGTDSGEQEIRVVVPGVGEDASSVALDVGGEGDLSFAIPTSAGDGGDYEVRVTSPTVSATQSLTVEGGSGGGNGGESGNGGGNGGNGGGSGGNGGGNGDDGVVTEQDGNNAPGFGIGTAIAGLGTGAYLLKRRVSEDDE